MVKVQPLELKLNSSKHDSSTCKIELYNYNNFMKYQYIKFFIRFSLIVAMAGESLQKKCKEITLCGRKMED